MRDKRQHVKSQLPAWRWLVSLLIVVHLTAVFISPFAFISSSPGSVSPAAAAVAGQLSAYSDLAFLNHGYAFFAPNPGPSHLVRYRLEFDDERPALEGQFPDRQKHWPRLLYHRHFMLSEQLHSDSESPDPPPTNDRNEIDAWRRRRDLYEAKFHCYENHLLNHHGASRVTMVRVEHQQPDWADVLREGKRLDAADLFRELSEDSGEIPLPTPFLVPDEESQILRVEPKEGE
jgi:hypothetical protein